MSISIYNFFTEKKVDWLIDLYSDTYTDTYVGTVVQK